MTESDFPHARDDAENMTAALTGLVAAYRRDGDAFDGVPLVEALVEHLPPGRAVRTLVALALSAAHELAGTDWQPDEDEQ